MTQPGEARSALRRLGGRIVFPQITAILTALPLFCLLPVTLSGNAYGRASDLILQTTQETASAGNGKDIQSLEPGKPIRRELGGGKEHGYQIKLNADQFLKCVVEQQGIDVIVQVSGPNGNHILEFDSESRSLGKEEISLVAEAPGVFLLAVRPKLTRAPAGSYEIQIEELRVATDTDRALHDSRKQLEGALKLQRAGKYDEALPLAERAMEIRERLLGADHRDVAAALDLLADIYNDRGKYAKAESLYLRALALREKALGNDHPYTGASLNHLGTLYRQRGKYGEAEPLLKRALDIREKALGKEHPSAAESLDDLAQLYKTQGKYEDAEPLYKRALDIREKALGRDHPDTASSLNNLALLYQSQWKLRVAEPLLKRALDIREKALGKEHPLTANSLNSLAELYKKQGEYVEAEPLLKRALDIREKALGRDHPRTAISLNNLAMLYQTRGKYEDAEPLFKRALDIWEKSLGKDHPNVAISLSNLAIVYTSQGKYAAAESVCNRALDICEKAVGKDHPSTAVSLNNLAGIYKDQGKYEDAEPLLKRALGIWEKALGKDHPNTATSLNSLAQLYALQGKYDEAEPLYNRALGIREKALGKDHPETVSSLNDLAVLYTAKGDLVQAVKFQALANAASERSLARNLVIGSERQKLAYLATLSGQTDRTLSLHVRSAPNDPIARNLAANLILQRKGRALDATSQNLNALRSRFNPEDQALLDRLTDTRTQIAALVFSGPQEMTGEQYQARFKELEDQADKDEAVISRRSAEFRAQFLTVTLDAVQAAIPTDAALIEFATYRPFNARAAKVDESYGRPHYVAYVLRHNGEIQWRELGDAETIDRAITALRKALGNPNSHDVKRLSRVVDERVFRPIRSQVGESRQLLVSPDGPLNLIPFAALVDEEGRYLVERYAISYLTSGRDLLRLQVAGESQSGPMVIANPDFGTPGGGKEESPGQQPAVAEAAEEQSARSAFDQIRFSPLRYTAKEGEALRALLPDATVLTGRQATKAALMQVRSPRLLHIATHGFFLKNLDLTPTGARGGLAPSDDPSRTLQELEKSHIRIESPLLRSGLALAGANEHQEKDNGILTALEVTGLNLWGTKLVALSACDTGVGEAPHGDGVHGLRRALVLAGSETQVMSLWSVLDRTARDLMVAYYRRLKEGEGRGEALRQAQLEMLRGVKRRHPYYWASFIQSGEWANLDGHR